MNAACAIRIFSEFGGDLIKSDSFSILHRSAAPTRVAVGLRVEPAGDMLQVELSVRATNNTPDGLRKNQIGPNIDLDEDPLAFGEYFGVVVVTLPATASVTEVGEGQILANGVDGENPVVALRARVKRGEAEVWIVNFEIPASDNLVVLEPSARLDPTFYASGQVLDGDDIRHEIDLNAFKPPG